MSDPDASPLFIVGPSRSGTAMMRSILNEHSSIHLVGETHYFDDLRTRQGFAPGFQLVETALLAAVDYFRALDDRPYGLRGNPERSSLSVAELRARSVALGGTSDAVFEAYCRIKAEWKDAIVWGEKTPRHVFRLAEILDRFPSARIICMVRDPRAVVASYANWSHRRDMPSERADDFEEAILAERRRTHNSYHPIIAALLWRAAANAAADAQRRFGTDRIRLQRYEDVIEAPENTVREICTWIELEFQPNMLNVPMHNSSFNDFDAAAGLRRDALARWRQTLSPGEIGVVELVAGGAMRNAGYKPVGRANLVDIAKAGLSLPIGVSRAFLANRDRMEDVPRYVWRRLRAMLG